jgi:hypothetical protein
MRETIEDEGNGCLANSSEKISNSSEKAETRIPTPTF